MQDVSNHPNLQWDWQQISGNPNLTLDFVLNNLDNNWAWWLVLRTVSLNNNREVS